MDVAIVSGGAGFIGSHLCASLLERGLSVVCLDNLITGRESNLAAVAHHPHFAYYALDVSDPAAIAGLQERIGVRASFVFHLASPASVVDYLRFPIETMRANSQGTWNLLELARQMESRFLLASTSEVYGDPLIHPQPESYWGNVNPNGVRSCYDESKRFAEALTAQFWRGYGVDARIVRIFNTYGPHSRLDDGRIVPNFIGQALAREPMTIYGDGSQTRSFCFVSDLVAGLQRVIFAPDRQGEVYNLGNPREQTVLEFAQVVARLTGYDQADIAWKELPEDDPTRRQPDISRARTHLGWEPQVSLEQGLAQTIDWFRSQLVGSTGTTDQDDVPDKRIEERV